MTITTARDYDGLIERARFDLSAARAHTNIAARALADALTFGAGPSTRATDIYRARVADETAANVTLKQLQTAQHDLITAELDSLTTPGAANT